MQTTTIHHHKPLFRRPAELEEPERLGRGVLWTDLALRTGDAREAAVATPRDAASWEQYPWLTFQDKGVEGSFRAHFAAQQERVSRIVCWTWGALMALMAACTASSVLSLAPAALSLLHTIAAMAFTSRDWSHLLRRHRMLAVVCLRVCSALVVECTPFPSQRREALWGMLLAKPVVLAINSLGMRLPLAENALLQAACLVPALLSSSCACAELSATAGGDSTAFADIAQALSQASGLMQAPFKLDAAGGDAHQEACRRVLAFAHVMLSLVLPIALLYRADARSRAAFQAATRRPAAPRPAAGLHVLDEMFMLPLLVSLMALLAWEALQLLPL